MDATFSKDRPVLSLVRIHKVRGIIQQLMSDALAYAVGAVPWYSIPDNFSIADLKEFIDDRCNAITTYGFPSVWIEQSNEDWNGATAGAVFGFAGTGQYYGAVAGHNFSVMSAEVTAKCSGSAGSFYYVMGNQLGNNGVWYNASVGATNAGFSIPNTTNYGTDDAPYNTGNTCASGSLPAYTGSLASQAAQYASLFFTANTSALYGGTNCVPDDMSIHPRY